MRKEPKTVLVVEDDADVSRLIVKMVEGMGVRVLTAGDGVEGAERAAAEQPDLVLVDLVMPRMGGIDLVRALKADRRLSRVPIIVLTGHASADSVKEAAQLGVQDFLVKANFLAGSGLDRIRRALRLPARKPRRRGKAANC